MSGSWYGACVIIIKEKVRGHVIKISFLDYILNNQHALSHTGCKGISQKSQKNSHKHQCGLEYYYLLLQKAVQSSLGILGMK